MTEFKSYIFISNFSVSMFLMKGSNESMTLNLPTSEETRYLNFFKQTYTQSSLHYMKIMVDTEC